MSSADIVEPLLTVQPLTAFSMAISTYCILLPFIYLQNRYFQKLIHISRNRLEKLLNIELIVFLICFYFFFGAQSFFNEFRLSLILSALCSFVLYFGGLGFGYYAEQRAVSNSRNSWAAMQNRLKFLLPFAIPFMIFMALDDFTKLLPIDLIRSRIGIVENSFAESAILFGCIAILMVGMMLLLPRMIVVIWKCRNLKDSVLTQRLEAICRKANFKQGGIKTLGIMKGSLTAAIIGITPRFRYVMFTEELLQRLSPESIEGVLIHEIGHSKRRHLLVYPFIFLGITACALFLTSIVEEFLIKNQLVQAMISSLNLGRVLEPLVFFILFAFFAGVLFRYVFGYFSRLFERQADLHIFEVGLRADQMIQALNEIAMYSGFTHHVPSWHHYSIMERVNFLRMAQSNPNMIKKHHRKTAISLIVYFLFLAILLIMTQKG